MTALLACALALPMQLGALDGTARLETGLARQTVAPPLQRLAPLDPDAPASPRAERAEWLDPGAWSSWWRYHRHRILDLDARIHRADVVEERVDFEVGRGEEQLADDLRPDPAWVQDRLVPTLLELLADEPSKDLRASALLALGRASSSLAEPDARILDALRSSLQDRNAEVVESAIVALGYLGGPSVPTLSALLADTRDDRALRSRSVPERWRCFAAYSLGIAAQRIGDRELLVRVADVLERTLLARASDDELRAACATGLGALASAPALLAASAQDRLAAATAIHTMLERAFRRADPEEAAHLLVPWAAWSATVSEEAQQTILSLVVAASKGPPVLARSAAVALGQLRTPAGPAHAAVRQALAEAARHTDRRTRALAWLAIAERAANVPPRMRDEELRWARDELAPALAVEDSELHGFALLANGLVEHTAIRWGRGPSDEARERLRAHYADLQSSELRAAGALGLGLARDLSASARLEAELAKSADDRLRRPLALALGLIDLRRLPPLRELLETSLDRAELLESVAAGLVLQRDRTLAPRLAELLSSRSEGGRFEAVVRALGRVGDGRVVAALLRELQREERPSQERAALATALGRLAHLGPDVRHERLAPLTPWWSPPPALSDPATATGLLDLL